NHGTGFARCTTDFCKSVNENRGAVAALRIPRRFARLEIQREHASRDAAARNAIVVSDCRGRRKMVGMRRYRAWRQRGDLKECDEQTRHTLALVLRFSIAPRGGQREQGTNYGDTRGP